MYKTINGWTKETMKQQIRLKNNGTKSVDEISFSCRYRGANNNACAVGCFIPDEFYDQDIEGLTPNGTEYCIFSVKPELSMFVPLLPGGLLTMQRVHDTYEGSRDIRDVLCEWIDKNVEDSE